MQNINNKIPIRRDENISNTQMRNTGELLGGGRGGRGLPRMKGLFVSLFRDFSNDTALTVVKLLVGLISRGRRVTFRDSSYIASGGQPVVSAVLALICNWTAGQLPYLPWTLWVAHYQQQSRRSDFILVPAVDSCSRCPASSVWV